MFRRSSSPYTNKTPLPPLHSLLLMIIRSCLSSVRFAQTINRKPMVFTEIPTPTPTPPAPHLALRPDSFINSSLFPFFKIPPNQSHHALASTASLARSSGYCLFGEPRLKACTMDEKTEKTEIGPTPAPTVAPPSAFP